MTQDVYLTAFEQLSTLEDATSAGGLEGGKTNVADGGGTNQQAAGGNGENTAGGNAGMGATEPTEAPHEHAYTEKVTVEATCETDGLCI